MDTRPTHADTRGHCWGRMHLPVVRFPKKQQGDRWFPWFHWDRLEELVFLDGCTGGTPANQQRSADEPRPQ